MSKKLFGKFFVLLLVVGLLFAVAPTRQAQAADINVTCTGTGDSVALQNAISGATDGDTIFVTGTCVLDTNITVSKDVTLDGGNLTAKIQVSGTGYRITMTTPGASLQGFEIEKTDKTGGQDIIWINASNITVQNNKVHGQFVIGDGEVSRAIVISGGNSGLLITGNEFYSLRQPAYISGVTTGTISNNYTHGTKGWVLEGGNLTFTGNTWGSVANGNPNVFDIAILTQVGPVYYSDVPAMSAANNNAFIEDQRYSPALLTPVYVDASVPTCTDCGTARMPYDTIQEGVDRVIPGGTVYVAGGNYTEQVTVNGKNGITIVGAGETSTTIISPAMLTALTGDRKAVFGIKGSENVTVKNLTIDGAGKGNSNYRFYGLFYYNSGGLIDHVTVKDIRNTPLDGAQSGVAIYGYVDDATARTITTQYSTAIGYQKGGFTFNGAGLTAMVDHNTATGAGQIPNISMNGIQIGFGANATVIYNTTSGNYYTGDPAAGLASGILLYQPGNVTVQNNTVTTSNLGIALVDGGTVSIKGNVITDNQYSLDLTNNAATVENNQITGSIASALWSDKVVDASPNWWGSAAGPLAGFIEGPATYIPWCGEAACTTLVYPPVHNVTQGTYFYTIQAAIDAAASGDAIQVAAGTYDAFSVVGKTNLTITGAGDGQTFIEPTTLITTGVGHKYTPNMLATVFVNNSTGIKIEGMTIKSTTVTPGGTNGNDAIVFWNNSSGSIEESIVLGIYAINGGQTGQGIAVDGGTSVLLVKNTDISGFQKNGIDVVDGNGLTTALGTLTVNVSGGVITGAGPTAAIAQNGISFFNRGGGVLGGSVTDASISGFDYTPTDNEATGILAYGLGGGTLTVTGNSFGVSEISLTDLTGTLDLDAILLANTFPAGSAVVGNNIMIPPTKLLMDPATVATTDTCTGTHEVTVKVQAVTDLVAYYLNMTYDKDLITVTNVQNLTLAGVAAPGNTWAGGVINFGWYNPNGGGNPPTYNGDVNLIKITFQSNGLAGTSAFTILPTSSLVEWPDAFGIPYEITGGSSVSFGSIVTNTTQTKSYCDLAVAVAQAAGGDTLRVDANITTRDSITVGKALILNTNGKTISRTGTDLVGNDFFVVNPGGNLTVNGGGTITTTKHTAIRITGDPLGATPAKVTLENATVYGPYFSVAVIGNEKYVGHETAYPAVFEMTGGATNETVFVSGNGAELSISGGTLTGAAPIMGNGLVSQIDDVNKGGTKITIGGTAVVNGNTNLAIYHPQDGLLTINGNATITGTNGIEMKAGDLVVNGGTIRGTATACADPTATGNGSTDTGDAILIFNRNGYGAGQLMDVTISGTPTITSNCYALREFTLSGETSRLGVAAISGGHFTGGTPGAVSFTTVSDANLDLTGGDYSTDPIAYVYPDYGTSLHSDGRWYISLLPVLSSTTFDDQVTLGVSSNFMLTVNPSVPGDFTMVFTGYPSETEITFGSNTYTCVMSGTPAVCTITVPVTLTGLSQDLAFSVVVATGGAETPATSYAVTATLHAPAPAYGPTGRDLDSLSATVPVTPGFTVSGTVTMQGRTTRAGVPVYLTWNNTLGVTYGPHMDTDEQAVNFRLTVNYGGSYTVTTLQPRYLNITSDLAKNISVNANYKFANPLWLRAGNAIWRNPGTGAYDNTIGVTDATKVLAAWATTGLPDGYDNSGDVNFDNIVNIKDLTLVGGNMDLTSATAYSGIGANLWIP